MTKESIYLDVNVNKDYLEHCKNGRIEFITFHPSYSYEEFIEGITVKVEEGERDSSDVKYTLKPGIFKILCKNALGAAINIDKDELESKTWTNVYNLYKEYCAKNGSVDFKKAPKLVLIIDEINRGDISKIFGELITLLESDKRIGEPNELIVRLPTSGDLFGVPPNIYIIGTMNTADRSIALLDVALRRRFGFIEMNPDFNLLKKEHIDKNEKKLKNNGVYTLLLDSVAAIEKINANICEDRSIGRDKQIGHSFFFKVSTKEDLLLVWKHEIFPLLEEYCYNNYAKLNSLVFNKDSDTRWIKESKGIQEIDDLNAMLTDING